MDRFAWATNKISILFAFARMCKLPYPCADKSKMSDCNNYSRCPQTQSSITLTWIAQDTGRRLFMYCVSRCFPAPVSLLLSAKLDCGSKHHGTEFDSIEICLLPSHYHSAFRAFHGTAFQDAERTKETEPGCLRRLAWWVCMIYLLKDDCQKLPR